MQDLKDFVREFPILSLVLAVVFTIIGTYVLACAIDLFAPIDTDRGSWWNIAYWFIRFIAEV